MNITRRQGRSATWILATLGLSWSSTSAFVTTNQNLQPLVHTQIYAGPETSEETSEINGRRDFLRLVPVSVMSGVVGLNVLTSQTPPALAAEEVVLPTREDVTKSFDFIRYELNDANGGVTYMQGRIDAEDFAGLLDFCKTYDLEFRKLRLSGAKKKLMQDKELKSQATEYANAVTFDLIGINRSCRNGQESKESANKYLQELREDITKFLALEEKIQVQD